VEDTVTAGCWEGAVWEAHSVIDAWIALFGGLMYEPVAAVWDCALLGAVAPSVVVARSVVADFVGIKHEVAAIG